MQWKACKIYVSILGLSGPMIRQKKAYLVSSDDESGRGGFYESQLSGMVGFREKQPLDFIDAAVTSAKAFVAILATLNNTVSLRGWFFLSLGSGKTK